jgi:hypothetical protein
MRLYEVNERMLADLATLDGAPMALSRISSGHLDRVLRARTDNNLSAVGVAAATEESRRRADAEIAAAMASATAAADDLERTLPLVMPDPLVLDTAEELRITAAWSRMRAQLDAGRGAIAVIDGVRGDRTSLEALRRELPSWLELQHVRSHPGLAGVTGEAQDDELPAPTAILARIEDHEAALGGPDAVTALGMLRRTAIGREALRQAWFVASEEVRTGIHGPWLGALVPAALARQGLTQQPG